MQNNGKKLEELVAFVEETLLQKGFDIKSNERVFNEDGVQIAEFDVLVKGKLGTTNIAWLIECRDRPSQGAAPAEWIQQLVGKRSQFSLNKVTAVSTTGFAPGAIECAKKESIELREVKELSQEYFVDWIAMQHMCLVTNVHDLQHITLIPDEATSQVQLKALENLLKVPPSDGIKVISSVTGVETLINNAFIGAVSSKPEMFDGIVANQNGKKVRILANYKDDDHYNVSTSAGLIKIKQIEFIGELSLKESYVPVSLSEYRQAETGEVISQLASFEFSLENQDISLEMHRVPQDGNTHVLLRAKKK